MKNGIEERITFLKGVNHSSHGKYEGVQRKSFFTLPLKNWKLAWKKQILHSSNVGQN